MDVMRVGINATPLSASHIRGWTRYTINLLSALPAQGVRPVLLAKGPLNADLVARLPVGSFEVETAPAMSHARWEQRWIPRACRALRLDVYHCPLSFGVPALCPVPRVLTLHDAIDRMFNAPRTPWRRWILPGEAASRAYGLVARTFAERIITVSEHARGDLLRAFGLRSDRVTVIPEAADPSLTGPADPERASTGYGLHRPYFFYVGGWEERKNLPFLVEAFAAARLVGVELVLAGGGEGCRGELARLAGDLGVADRVRLLGFVPDEDLSSLYASALGFVYPSLYEGFGLQLVEAMAVGCPVLAARTTCLPEVLGDGGETFGLEGPHELVAHLEKLAFDPSYRRDLADRALRRSRSFSWHRTAAATAGVYRELLAQAA